jgi:hypothetical protein
VEHRGHDALVRVDDRRCTDCHEDLHRDDGSPPGPGYGCEGIARKVHRFDVTDAHPDFRRRNGNETAYPDPGRIRFNHAVHLSPGGVEAVDQEELNKQLDEVARNAFEPLAPPFPVKKQVLDCADCHRMDAEGRYAEPIAYERHCKSCHPLLASLDGEWDVPRLRWLGWRFARTSLRHPSPGGTPLTVRAELRQRLADFIRSTNDPSLLQPRQAPPAWPLPARDPDGVSLTKDEYAWVNRQLSKTEGGVLRGCRYCHQQMKPAMGDADGLPVMTGSSIPARWWDNANFEHAAHRMLKCVECHPAAQDSTKSSDVLLPGKATCVKCHVKSCGPAARADCAGCHSYHDPKAQRQARERGRLSIEELRKR